MHVLSRLKTGSKIYTLIGFFMFAIALISYTGVNRMVSIGDELKSIAHKDIPLIEVLAKITSLQLEQELILERSLRYSGLTVSAEESVQELGAAEKEFADHSHEADREILAGEKLLTAILASQLSPEERVEMTKVQKALIVIDKEHAEFEHQAELLFESVHQGNTGETGRLVKVLGNAEVSLQNQVTALLEEVEGYTEKSALHAEDTEETAMKLIAVIGGVAGVIGLVLGVVVTRLIVRPLGGEPDEMQSIAEQIASGNLNIPRKKGATGVYGSLLLMSDRLNDTIGSMQENAEVLATATAELSATAIQIQKSTEEVNIGLESSTSAIMESSSNTAALAESIENMSQLSDRIFELAAEAKAGAANGQASMSETSAAIANISDSSAKIVNIINVITEIANQTNLLSLNAAIEAAKAGELGKGFAVVADEVRLLADRSASAVGQIRGLIDVSSSHVQEGTAVVLKTSGALEGITAHVGNISDSISEIRDGMRAQSLGAQEMSEATGEISEISETNSAAMTELASAMNQVDATIGDLAKMADSLKSDASFFQLRSVWRLTQ